MLEESKAANSANAASDAASATTTKESEPKTEEEKKEPGQTEDNNPKPETETKNADQEPPKKEEEEEPVEYGPVKVTLIDGTCECFGSELVPNKEYVFNPGMIFALFTWSGCQLSITGGAFKQSLFIILYSCFFIDQSNPLFLPLFCCSNSDVINDTNEGIHDASCWT